MISDHLQVRLNTLGKSAIQQWGYRAQITKAIEELSELSVQLCKVLNGSPTTNENVIDEIADVTIMISQLRLLYDRSQIDDRIIYKLDRLERVLTTYARPLEEPSPQEEPYDATEK